MTGLVTRAGRRRQADTASRMPSLDHSLAEDLSIDGPETRRWVLESEACAEFRTHRIARLGLEETRPPYRRVRVQPAGSFFLATTMGEGRILLDGKWQRVTEGSLFMAPPRVLNAFYTASAKGWRFAWLRYAEPHWVRPLVGAASPVRAAAGGAELARCLGGLQAEWAGPRDPKHVHHWVSLIHSLAQRAAQPMATDDRLAAVWAAVAENLADPWTLDRLASLLHASTEQLRRRCQFEMGRSPMQQVTYMRMQQAQLLLEATEDKLDVVAARVGYADGLVFSRAFKRWIGVGPREYRSRK